MLTPVEALATLHGSAAAAELHQLTEPRQVRAALRRGDVVRVARGRYALPGAPEPFLSAARLDGVVSHRSAALCWGMSVVGRPTGVDVTVGRHRRGLRPAGSVRVHWADLAAHERRGRITDPVRTVLDCARTLPFGEALAVADSALRLRLVGRSEVTAQARSLRGGGRARVLAVVLAADARAASPLESLLRALLHQAGVVGFVPQLEVVEDGVRARVDLGDRRLRIVVEADSFEHHGHRAALVSDCRRYDELAVHGWLVLRFTWEHVVGEPAWVVQTVLAAVAARSRRRAA